MIRRTLLALAAGAVLVAGCGSQKLKTATYSVGDVPPAAKPTVTPKPTGPFRLAHPAAEKNLKAKPPIPKPTGAPPSKLKIRDIVKGKGAVAKKTGNLTVQYVGVLTSTGKQLDASWDHNSPFKFSIGEPGAVIPGWQKGIPGMRVGGRRQLIIPPDLAYGAEGQPPDIPPDETLIFDIDLVKVGK